jgi:RNA polymerase sigma factor (sigma-70 family)
MSESGVMLAQGRPRVVEERGGEFEALYRAHVKQITAFFARRARDPQAVADLTADTFVAAIGSFVSSPPRKDSERAWLFAIARRIYAKHCELSSRREHAARRAGAERWLGEAALDELHERIDAERLGRELLAEIGALPARDREAIELVELIGMEPSEAAETLGISAGAFRVRLFRARARLRKDRHDVRL